MLRQPEATRHSAPVSPAIFKSSPIPSETSSEHFCFGSSGVTNITMLTIWTLCLQFQTYRSIFSYRGIAAISLFTGNPLAGKWGATWCLYSINKVLRVPYSGELVADVGDLVEDLLGGHRLEVALEQRLLKLLAEAVFLPIEGHDHSLKILKTSFILCW